MTKRQAKAKPTKRRFWIVESEYGWDFKRYIFSTHKSESVAKTFKAYLDAKNPYDKHELFEVVEV